MMTLDEFQPDYRELSPMTAFSVRESYYAHIAPVPALPDTGQPMGELRARATAACQALDDKAYAGDALMLAIAHHVRRATIRAATRAQLLVYVARMERALALLIDGPVNNG